MAAIVVREARTADLPAMAALLARRDLEDGVREPATPEVAARQLHGLDPSRCRAFVAVDAGGQVVAMNAGLLRTLRAGDRVIPAAYWTNLYVHPDHRNAMLYPRVVAALRQAMTAEGRLLYTAVRREAVAKAHERLGFSRLAEMPLLVKPLRPLRLFARRRRWPELFAAPFDLAWSLALRAGWRWMARGSSGEVFTPSDFSDLASLMQRAAGERIAPAWTPAELEHRLVPTFAGDVSGAIALHTGGHLLAAALWQDGARMRSRLRVILDLVNEPEHRPAARRVLAACERDALRDGCDAVLCLDGEALRGSGYFRSGARYILLADGRGPVRLDGTAWRFGLIEHDAF